MNDRERDELEDSLAVIRRCANRLRAGSNPADTAHDWDTLDEELNFIADNHGLEIDDEEE